MRRGNTITVGVVMTPEQIEILIMDSAIDSQKQCVARMKRRRDQAETDWAIAHDDLHNMQCKLQYMRESLLLKGCV